MLLLRYRLFWFTALLIFLVGLAGEVDGQRSRKQGRRGPDNAPKVGDKAPVFKLKLLYDKEEKAVDINDYNGKRPVALIFGSYT
ncbi:MAG: hypothetical protein GY940_39595 [bacterium]|nr:hypothetical protein [bacterium]